MEQHTPSQLVVTREEAGGKLLRFLERRLHGDFPPAMFHKWIRTGQVRVNGKRAKPFLALAAGDQVRLPPFALPRSFPQEGGLSSPTGAAHPAAGLLPCSSAEKCGEGSLLQVASAGPEGLSLPFLGADVAVVAVGADMLVVAKPAGLAVQGGSALADSLAGWLVQAYAHQPFTPAPVHRLDRATSGLVVIGTTHAGLQRLSALFATPQGLHKEYLAVVRGHWPQGASLVSDTVEKRQEKGFESMAVTSTGGMLPVTSEAAQGLFRLCGQGLCPMGGEDAAALPPGDAGAFPPVGTEEAWAFPQGVPLPELPPGFNAHCVATCLHQGVVRPPGGASIPASLVRIRLLTGRKHQIRVQFSHRGFPLIGDTRYGGPAFPQLLLHAAALRFPDGVTCMAAPAWPGVEELWAGASAG